MLGRPFLRRHFRTVVDAGPARMGGSPTGEGAMTTMTAREETLKAFDTARGEIDRQIKYYKPRKTISKCASIAFRIVAAACFLAGSLVPLLAPLQKPDDANYALGYFFLGLAGLLVVLDQFFLGSRSWSRYTKAYLKLGFLASVVVFEKKRFELVAPDDASAAEKMEAALNRIAECRALYQSIVNEETGAWETELGAAISAFQTQLAAVRTQAAIEEKAAQAAAPAGVVEVTVTGAGKTIASVGLSVGDGPPRPLSRPFAGPFVFDVPAGLRKARLVWALERDPKTTFSKEMAVSVKAGEIARLSIAVDTVGKARPLTEA